MSQQAEAAAKQIELIADSMGQVAAGSTAAAATSGAGEVSAATQDLRQAAKAVGGASGDLLSASNDIKQRAGPRNEEVGGAQAYSRGLIA